MIYDIVHEQTNTGDTDILAAWLLYFLLILSLAGYQLVKVFW